MTADRHWLIQFIAAVAAGLVSIATPARSEAQSLPKGWSVSGTGDQVSFVHRSLRGDATVVARVVAFRSGDSGSQAGVMIRSSLADGSPYAFIFATPGGGVTLRSRTSSGGATVQKPGGPVTGSVWLRIVRRSSNITAWRSSDGAEWTRVGTIRVATAESVLVGFAASRSTATAVTASFSNMSVNGTRPFEANVAPTVSLGSPNAHDTFLAPATITMTAAAADSDGTVARVDFYAGATLLGSDVRSPYTFRWQQVPPGTYSLHAVAVDNDGASTVSDWVSVTVDEKTSRREGSRSEPPYDPGPPPTPVETSSGVNVEPRPGPSFSDAAIGIAAAASGNGASTGGGMYSLPAGTSKGTASTTPSTSGSNTTGGNASAATTSPDPRSVRAVAEPSDPATSPATSFADNAGITDATTPTGSANRAPSVSLTSPASGTSLMAPASTTLTAIAADTDGRVVRVDFYAGATYIGSDTSSPYSVAWSSVPAGSYLLTAAATDDSGTVTVSASVSVTVSGNQAPTVSLTSPANGASFTTGSTITLTASASDADGTIQKVEFYNGTTLLGSSTTSPFTFNWQNVAAGTYSLSSVARDNLGATTVSSWKDITVSSSVILSTAIFTPAVVPGTIDYYLFEVFVAGADPATAAPVASQNLGIPAVANGECTADVRNLISGLVPGSYFARVSSYSADDGFLRSAPFSFTR